MTQYDLEEDVREMVKTVPVPYMADAVYRYILAGIQPGDFLCALLDNDLMLTVFRADSTNTKWITDVNVDGKWKSGWVRWLYNADIPGNCWGGPELRKAWQESGGLVGKYRASGELEEVA